MHKIGWEAEKHKLSKKCQFNENRGKIGENVENFAEIGGNL